MRIRPLNLELQNAAGEVLHEDEKTITTNLEYIKEWLQKKPHLQARTDDQWLIGFLRGCKYSLERTKEKLDMYYTLQEMLPQFYQWRNSRDPKMNKMLRMGYILPLPLAAPDAPRVLYFRQSVIDPAELDFDEIISMYTLYMKYLIANDDNAVVEGLNIVVNLEETTLNHFSAWTPPALKKAFVVFQSGFPIRPQSLEYVNMPAVFEGVFKLIRMFLNDKINARIHIHSDVKDLQKRFPKSVLPKDIGGDGPTFQELTDEWVKKLEDFSPWFEEDFKYGCDESKRQGNPKTSDDLFGLGGSFRPLTID